MNTEQELFDRVTLELNGLSADCLVPMREVDDNWQRLKAEKQLPKVTERQAVKLANCRVRNWHSNDRLATEYDIGYSDGTRELNKRTNGEFSQEEPFTHTALRVYDALITLVARSHGELDVCKSARFYLPNNVKTVIRDFYFMQVKGKYAKASWFVFNDAVYFARLDEMDRTCDTWVFNHKRKVSVEEFLEQCWSAV
jgi:hypothetical protein